MATAAAQHYFRFPNCWCHSIQMVNVYQQTKFCRQISIHGSDITTSDLDKQTSAILQFYFRFRSQPFRHNLHVILHQVAEFRPNWRTLRENVRSYRFLKILLPISYLLTSLSSEGHYLLADQILSTYLNSWLRCNYFRFGKTNVRCIEILLPVSISTISP